MKISFQHSRYISFIVTMLACVASIVMMVKFFDFPISDVLSYLFVCIVALFSLITVSACAAFMLSKVKIFLVARAERAEAQESSADE